MSPSISWTWEQALFLSQSPLDNQTIWLSNNFCVCQKYGKNTEFYPGTVVPLFVIKINLVQPGYWKIPAWHFKNSLWLLVSLCVIVLCGPPFWIGLQTTAFGKFLFSWWIWTLCRLCNSKLLCINTCRGYSIANVCFFGTIFTQFSKNIKFLIWSMRFSLAIHRLVVLYYGGWNRLPFIKRKREFQIRINNAMWDIKREGGSERDQTEGLNFRIPCHFIL